MTHARRYALCCDAVRAYALETEQDPAALLQMMTKDLQIMAGSKLFPVLAMLAEIMQEAREGMDRANTSGAVLAAVRRIAKASTRDDLRGGWIDDEGRFCVCSGYHAARLAGARFDSVPAVTGWPGLGKCMERPEGLHPVELPSVAAVKAWMAEHGKKEPMPLDGGARYVNPGYLLDMLQALPGAVAWAGDHPAGSIYFDTGKGDGILLPVRPPRR